MPMPRSFQLRVEQLPVDSLVGALIRSIIEAGRAAHTSGLFCFALNGDGSPHCPLYLRQPTLLTYEGVGRVPPNRGTRTVSIKPRAVQPPALILSPIAGPAASPADVGRFAQPPWVKPPRVSSSGRPGLCMTPSRVM